MTVKLHRRHKPAKGCSSYGSGRAIANKRIVVEFDGETFHEIGTIAKRHKRSFAAQVRELVEFGLLDLQAMEGQR